MVRTAGLVVALLTAEVGACLLEPPRAVPPVVLAPVPPESTAADDDVDGAGEAAAGRSAARAAGAEGSIADALATLRGALSALLDGAAYDVAATAEQSAEALRAAVRAACANASITHDPGAVTVVVDFSAGCDVGGRGGLVTGAARATVRREQGALVLEIATTSLAVDGYVFDGISTAATRDGASWTWTVDVAVDPVGAATFTGTAATARGAVVLDGIGLLQTGLDESIETDGWSCAADGTIAFTIDGLHKDLGDCRGDDGVAAGARTYTCVQEDRRGDVRESPARLATSARFTDDTPATGLIEVIVTMTIGAQSRSTSELVKLPAPRAACGG